MIYEKGTLRSFFTLYFKNVPNSKKNRKKKREKVKEKNMKNTRKKIE